MAFEALTGVNGDLVTISWMASKGANQTEHYLKEEVGGTVFFAFRASFSSEDLFATENTSPFGEIKMKRNQFPCMRSIGNDVDATVNEAFLKSLEVLIGPRTSFHASVQSAVDRKQQVVFTGHSFGGATAILATVWYLETYFIRDAYAAPEPRCVTFGAPLVGERIGAGFS
ncbi:Protein EDS1B [Arabidopsis thaliana]